MAEPDYFRMLEIPSPEEERTRSIISRPAPASGYQGYYQGIASRRAPSSGFASPQRRLSVREWEQAQGRAAYEQEARRAVQQLSSIEPDDPELPYKQEETLLRSRFGRDLVKDPRVVSVLKNRTAENLRIQKQFQDDPESQTDYIIARREGLDPRTALGRAMQASEQRKNRLWFTEKGGDLETFDSGQFMRNGRFDRAAAQSYINQIPKKKDQDKPWQERLSFKEGEAIREAARGAKSGTFQDFEEEFTAVQADNPKITRDEYVKQFKGDADFNAYQERRLMETGQDLMDEYGLSQQEAAQVLGIRPQMVQESVSAPSPVRDLSAGNIDSSRPVRGPEAMFEGVKATGPGIGAPASPSPAAPAPVSPADLKRDDLYNAAKTEPVTFESLSQQMAKSGESERKAREEEFLARQKEKEKDSGDWEAAKMKLLQGLTPEMIRGLTPSPSPAQFAEIMQRAGLDPEKPAFTYTQASGIPGRDVSWYEVLTMGLAQDPRLKQLQTAAPPQRTKSLSHLWEDVKGAVTGR
jgi:hypothetical protein